MLTKIRYDKRVKGLVFELEREGEEKGTSVRQVFSIKSKAGVAKMIDAVLEYLADNYPDKWHAGDFPYISHGLMEMHQKEESENKSPSDIGTEWGTVSLDTIEKDIQGEEYDRA